MNDDHEMLLAEYATLRAEIEHSVERRFRIVTAGAAVIPVVQFVGNRYDIGFVSLGLPLLVLIIALLFTAENNGIMRAGRYIREVIEPRLYPDGAGWERWLECQEDFDARLVDKMVVIGFYLIESLYYVIGVVIGLQFASQTGLGPNVLWTLGVTYALLFVLIAYLAVKQPRIRTVLLEERAPRVKPRAKSRSKSRST